MVEALLEQPGVEQKQPGAEQEQPKKARHFPSSLLTVLTQADVPPAQKLGDVELKEIVLGGTISFWNGRARLDPTYFQYSDKAGNTLFTLDEDKKTVRSASPKVIEVLGKKDVGGDNDLKSAYIDFKNAYRDLAKEHKDATRAHKAISNMAVLTNSDSLVIAATVRYEDVLRSKLIEQGATADTLENRVLKAAYEESVRQHVIDDRFGGKDQRKAVMDNIDVINESLSIIAGDKKYSNAAYNKSSNAKFSLQSGDLTAGAKNIYAALSVFDNEFPGAGADIKQRLSNMAAALKHIENDPAVANDQQRLPFDQTWLVVTPRLSGREITEMLVPGITTSQAIQVEFNTDPYYIVRDAKTKEALYTTNAKKTAITGVNTGLIDDLGMQPLAKAVHTSTDWKATKHSNEDDAFSRMIIMELSKLPPGKVVPPEEEKILRAALKQDHENGLRNDDLFGGRDNRVKFERDLRGTTGKLHALVEGKKESAYDQLGSYGGGPLVGASNMLNEGRIPDAMKNLGEALSVFNEKQKSGTPETQYLNSPEAVNIKLEIAGLQARLGEAFAKYKPAKAPEPVLPAAPVKGVGR